MNDIAKWAWALFFMILTFGVWTFVILIVWAIICYIIHYRKERSIR